MLNSADKNWPLGKHLSQEYWIINLSPPAATFIIHPASPPYIYTQVLTCYRFPRR